MSTHVCLASPHAAVNLLPALDPALRPERIVLVTTDATQHRAADLQAVLEAQAVGVRRVPLQNTRDLQAVHAQLRGLAGELVGERVAVNVSGGPSGVALVAQAVAGAVGWPAFHVDADRGTLVWLGGTTPPQPVVLRALRLAPLVRACGLELTGRGRCPAPTLQQWTLIQTLVTQLASLAPPLARLNGLVRDAQDRNSLYVQMSDAQLDSRNLHVLLDHFWRAGALDVLGDEIRFNDGAACDFIRGGWLRFHAMDAVNRLTGPLDIVDRALDLQLTDVQQGTEQTVDLAFVAHNRLFILAFDAARPAPEARSGAPSESSGAMDALFELSARRRRLAAAGARGMLLSHRRPTRPERQLAESLGLEVVANTSLMDLDRKISQWVGACA